MNSTLKKLTDEYLKHYCMISRVQVQVVFRKAKSYTAGVHMLFYAFFVISICVSLTFPLAFSQITYLNKI